MFSCGTFESVVAMELLLQNSLYYCLLQKLLRTNYIFNHIIQNIPQKSKRTVTVIQTPNLSPLAHSAWHCHIVRCHILYAAFHLSPVTCHMSLSFTATTTGPPPQSHKALKTMQQMVQHKFFHAHIDIWTESA